MYKEAAGLVAEKGYTNIATFKEGIPGWVKEGFPLNKEHALPNSEVPSLNAGELKGLLGNVVILDIRGPILYKMGWIKGSQKIPLGQLSARVAEIPKGKGIVVVDHAGNQVLAAGRFLKSKGYEDVKRLQGGVMAWVSQGLNLDK
jgi:rhodanese-related sulfurtransferase